MQFNVIFEKRSALVQFNLENVINAGWMGDVVLEVQVWDKTLNRTIPISDNSKEKKVSGLNLKDRVCLVFKMEPNETQRFCEVFMDETEPSTWQPKDIDLSVSCEKDSAKVTFNLIKLKEARWMDVLRPIFIYGYRVSKSTLLTSTRPTRICKTKRASLWGSHQSRNGKHWDFVPTQILIHDT